MNWKASGSAGSTRGELRVKQRIIVACKRFVHCDKRPSLLQGQQGCDFFAFEGPKQAGRQSKFPLDAVRSVITGTRAWCNSPPNSRRSARPARDAFGSYPASRAPRPPMVPSLPNWDMMRGRSILATPPQTANIIHACGSGALSKNGPRHRSVSPDNDVLDEDCYEVSDRTRRSGEADSSIHSLGAGEVTPPEEIN